MRRLLKALGALVLLAAIAMAGGFWYASRDAAPAHPTLASADLAPLIPVRDFYADRDAEWSFAASADGRSIAHWGTEGVEISVIVRDAETGNKITSFQDVDWFEWLREPNRLAIATEGRLYAHDLSTNTREDITPRGFSRWNISSFPRTGVDRMAVVSSDRAAAYNDLYSVTAEGRDKQLIARNDGTILNWLSDRDLEPRVRWERPEPDVTRLSVHDGNAWRTLVDLPLDQEVIPIELDGDAMLALSNRGRDKLAVVLLSLDDAREEVLVEFDDQDVGWVVNLDGFEGGVDMAVAAFDSTQRIPLTEQGEVLDGLISDVGDEVEIDSLFWPPDGRFVTATLSTDARSYTYHLFDLQEGTGREISEFAFRQNNLASIAPTEIVTIEARDGLQIPALLVRPMGADGPVPLLIDVHGGPAWHYSWGYDHDRQFLANRGYAVLAVNFRGSTGFGREFQEAGYREFGRAMQQDLEDAVAWAVDQGIADADAVGIIGGSYGGYAAAMAALQKPEMFQAAVVEIAMTDVPYQSQYPPASWGLSQALWTRYFGDPNDPDELAEMREYSPVTQAESLQIPMLVVAGRDDRVVGLEQSERLVEAAEAGNAEPELLILDGEGHGYSKWQSRVVRARRLEDFLARHLGGRSGGWDWIEVAADRL